MNRQNRQNLQDRKNISIAVIGGLLIALVLVLTTFWTGISARRSAEKAVNTVSNFYLRELAGGSRSLSRI